jgi:transcription initiation factor TFIIIB Brf1 subunit/transcription initiation factor TFIIB
MDANNFGGGDCLLDVKCINTKCNAVTDMLLDNHTGSIICPKCAVVQSTVLDEDARYVHVYTGLGQFDGLGDLSTVIVKNSNDEDEGWQMLSDMIDEQKAATCSKKTAKTITRLQDNLNRESKAVRAKQRQQKAHDVIAAGVQRFHMSDVVRAQACEYYDLYAQKTPINGIASMGVAAAAMFWACVHHNAFMCEKDLRHCTRVSRTVCKNRIADMKRVLGLSDVTPHQLLLNSVDRICNVANLVQIKDLCRKDARKFFLLLPNQTAKMHATYCNAAAAVVHQVAKNNTSRGLTQQYLQDMFGISDNCISIQVNKVRKAYGYKKKRRCIEGEQQQQQQQPKQEQACKQEQQPTAKRRKTIPSIDDMLTNGPPPPGPVQVAAA